MKDYGPRVTVRLSQEELQKAHALMARRGVSKISDFIRQALAAELTRQVQQDQIAAYSLERMKVAIDKGDVPPAPLGSIMHFPLIRSAEPAVAEDQAPYDAGPAPIKPKPKK